MIWHSSDISDIKKELNVDETVGLSSGEVAERIKKYGENRSFAKSNRKFGKEFAKRILKANYIALIIFALILIITGAIGGANLWISPVTVILIIFANAALGAVTAVENEKFSAELKDKVTISAKVLRDGDLVSVNAAHLVPGDIVLLEQGDYIPADGRLLEENSLICDESAVTGDSAPMKKNTEVKFDDICPLSERSNMVYSGCSVTYGRAVMIVTDTGKKTEIGKLNQIKEQTVGTETPSKKYLKVLGKGVSIALMISAAIIFLLGIIFVKTDLVFSDLVLTLITLALSLYAISLNKSLPRLVTSAISFSVSGMLNRKAIIKNPEKIETLGSVSVIISDKTGTLTRNNMKMTSMYDGTKIIDLYTDELNENAATVIRTAALCCDARTVTGSSGKTRIEGDPTEAGIVAACEKYCALSKDELENIYPRLANVPFDSDRKLMTTVNMINNRPFAIVKGAPDMLFACCKSGDIKAAAEAAEKMGSLGQRVIGVAIKPLSEVPANPNSENLECGLTFLGLFGMTDSLSRSTKNSVAESKSAGIKTVMVTGDNIATATAIAKELGILSEGEIAVTGEELEKMSDDELYEKVKTISVYCGINDSDKVRVVEAWQKHGETVSVTGDSVDDAAALKLADIGFAMGVTGKDIAKGSADVVLSDDSYISIVGAIKTARNNFFNIRHGVQLIFATAIGEIVAIILGFICFGSMVFTPQSLLFINTLLILILSRALAGEPDRKNSMQMPPRKKKEGMFSSIADFDFVWQGAALGVLTLLSYDATDKNISGSAAFTTFTLLLVFLTFSLRFCSSIYHEGFKLGKNMLISICLSVASILILTLTPVSYLFGINGIDFGTVLTAMGFGILLFVVCEGVKFIRTMLKK